MTILGIESSCDDTSVGVVRDGKVLSNIVSSQDHNAFGGVYPEHAARKHLDAIGMVCEQALKEARIVLEEVDVVSATYAPGLVGSLLVGYSFGRALSYGLEKGFFPVHHIKAHIYAAMIENEIELPALALVVSGGHTSLIILDREHNFKEIGSTLDDAVGEVYDKVGRMLGLPFPSGKIIDDLSQIGNANIDMPFFKSDDYNFSFSGVKSFVFRYLQANSPKKEDVAASFQRSVERAIVPKTIKAMKELNLHNLILAGGVAANSGLRSAFKKSVKNVYWPSMKLCLDNGAMVAAAAHFMINNGKDEGEVRVKPNLSLK